ncbi:MAG TPA: carboxypeptidase regulatory-like domain-containing protein, partial [Myxococcales bacterium]|nr:carboxypeptidase regulatory-like domain-containing protein [Myxococcales bacterium]
MQTKPWLAMLGVSLASMVGCSRDLTLPELPQRGKVTGSIDTGGHIPPGGNDVLLVTEDGARTSQVTDGQGAFTFPDVQPGLYFLSAALPGFAPLVYPAVRVRSGQTTDVGALAPAWLQGTASEGTLNGKVVANGGGSVEGGHVEFILQPVGQRLAMQALGADGAFAQRLPPGTYTLRATHPLYVTSDLPDVAVASSEYKDLTATPLVMALNPATLTGAVAAERDGLAPVPAAGALVTLENGTTTTTDVNGNFQLQGLPAGFHQARIQLGGYTDPTPQHAVTLVPGLSTALDPVILALNRGTITGTVQLADQQTARDVTVAVTGTPYAAVVTPDSAQPWIGRFRIPQVPAGTYEVSASKARYSRAVASSVTVTASATTDVGTLTLTLLQGDFHIDDGDASNTDGYTRSVNVTLDLSGFGSASQYRASEDGTFAGVSWQPFTGPSQPFMLAPAEGTHTVYAQYQDAGGTASAVFTSTIVLDSAAPTGPGVQINGGAAFTNVNASVVLTLSALESLPPGVDAVSGLAQVRISESGAVDAQGRLSAPPQPYQLNVLFLRPSTADGVQPVYVQFFDHAGNHSAVASASIVVDTQPPSGVGLSIQDGPRATAPGFTNTAVVTLSQSANPEPNGGFVLVKLANSSASLQNAVYQPLQATSSWILDPTGADLKTVYAVLRDAAGNTTGTLAAQITYDVTPPSPVSAALLGSSPTRQPAVTLSLSATDTYGLSPTQALTVSEDPYFGPGGTTVGPTAYPASNQVTYALSAVDGPKQVLVRFRDKAGNDATAAVSLVRDTTPPSGTFTVTGRMADGTPSSTYTFTSSVDVAVSSPDAVDYVLGDESLAACPASGYSALPVPPGRTLTGVTTPRTVRVCLRDAAGNPVGPLEQRITLDSSPPVGCQVALTGSKADGTAAPVGKTGRPTVTAALSCTGETPAEVFLANGSVTCSAGAALAWQPYTASLPFLLAGPDGTNAVSGCVRDAARNTTTLVAGTITLDTTPPQAPLVTIDNGAPYVNLAQVTARGGNVASVAGSATTATEWAIQQSSDFTGAAFQPFPGTSPRNFTFAGTGVQTIYAVFRDDVGNRSAVASSAIHFDVTPPSTAAAGVSIVSPTSNGYTGSVSTQVQLVAPPDAASVLLAQAASAAACQASDFGSATPRAVVPSYTFLLSPAEGLKRVCAQLLDAAGNPSAFISGTITLDTTPPSTPLIQTPSTTLNAPDNAPFTVRTVAANTEADFARYEQLGGKISNWAVASTGIGTTTFNFNLVSSGGAAAGVANVLRLRAVDLAGNASPEASVVVTTDVVPPLPITLSTVGVSNQSSAATLYWIRNGSDTDVAGYNVYYGPSSGAYGGAYALEGASPIRVSASAGSFTLSGLTNGSTTYATVRPVDLAGNEGSTPGSPAEVVMQPNAVSPSPLVDLPLSGLTNGTRVKVVGDYAYVLGYSGSCFVAPPGVSTAQTVLKVVDLRNLASPVGRGALNPSPPVPAVVFTATWNDAFNCYADNVTYYRTNAAPDLVVDGGWAFVSSGTKLRMLSLLKPYAPVEVTPIDFAAQTGLITSLNVVGTVLFVGGEGKLFAVDAGSLTDGNSGTTPALSSVIGTALNGYGNPGGAAVSKGWLIQTAYNFGSNAYAFDMTNAIDLNGATVFDATARKTMLSSVNGIFQHAQYASGNVLYVSHQFNGFQAFDLRNLWSWVSGSPISLTLLSQNQTAGQGPFEVTGGQAFVPNGA